MTDWITLVEAATYLGVRVEDLPRIINDYDVDVELDDEAVVIALDAADLREPLLEEFKKREGYRPDEPERQEEAQQEAQIQEAQAKQARLAKRAQMIHRVSMGS